MVREKCAELLRRMCEHPMPTKTYTRMRDTNSHYRELLFGRAAERVNEMIEKGGVNVNLEFSDTEANIKITCFYSFLNRTPSQCCVKLGRARFEYLLTQYDSLRCEALNDLATTNYRPGM